MNSLLLLLVAFHAAVEETGPRLATAIGLGRNIVIFNLQEILMFDESS